MEITVTAPNRIDLAGGTTDLYPLYLLMEGGYTVNLAISLSSRVILRERAARHPHHFRRLERICGGVQSRGYFPRRSSGIDSQGREGHAAANRC